MINIRNITASLIFGSLFFILQFITSNSQPTVRIAIQSIIAASLFLVLNHFFVQRVKKRNERKAKEIKSKSGTDPNGTNLRGRNE